MDGGEAGGGGDRMREECCRSSEIPAVGGSQVCRNFADGVAKERGMNLAKLTLSGSAVLGTLSCFNSWFTWISSVRCNSILCKNADPEISVAYK
ncbi:hypothetical protein CDAR_616831 [Caerostris darwini]|uniref:Uncharacterized protein n=1 Tax=Caerostris darwini TaxID=1538125 RepID=A0AAV4U3C0_9ARAC|nr:hypothetical protein CDAR_616831 [Caerostris darwini]